jgi:para-aminobenzoate synthetase component 1
LQGFKQPRKLDKKNYLNNISKSKKPFIIYKTNKGFDLFTDFSKKIILNNQNISDFLKRKYNLKKKIKAQIYLLVFLDMNY